MRVVTRVIVLKPAAAVSQSMPVPSVTPAARPKFITIGARDQAPVNVQSAPGTHRTCKGMLVLTWNGQKAVPSCRRVLSKARVVSGP